jgi:hypothetical protein
MCKTVVSEYEVYCMRRSTPPIVEDGGLLPVIKIGIDTPIVSGAHCCVGP